MRKRDELNNPTACMARARDDEMTFVLLARDEDAPGTIRDWIARRIRRGKNRPDDAQMLDAERCAQIMEAERELKAVSPDAAPAGAGIPAIDPANPPRRVDLQRRRMTRCQADEEEPCEWEHCPQVRDGEPKKSGRHCPLDRDEEPCP